MFSPTIKALGQNQDHHETKIIMIFHPVLEDPGSVGMHLHSWWCSNMELYITLEYEDSGPGAHRTGGQEKEATNVCWC